MTFFRRFSFFVWFWVLAGMLPLKALAAGNPEVSAHRGQGQKADAFVPGEILVRVKQGAGKANIDALHRRFGGNPMRRIDRFGIQRVRFGKGIAIDKVIERYKASGLIAQAERNARRYPQGAVVPDDPYYAEQWAVNLADVQKAWSIRSTERTVVVAVIDTGIDYTHPDLQDTIWTNAAEKNGTAGIDDDGNGYIDDLHGWDFADNDSDPMDYDGHGTHVAGILGAVGDNGTGVAGVSWNVRLMPLKVTGDSSSDMGSSDILEALEYAREKGVTIFNCSFGGPYDSAIEYEVFRSLQQIGGLVVCAAGNGGVNIDLAGNAMYPASYDLANILVVAACGKDGSLGNFSNYGPLSVDVMAPGVDILSTRPQLLAATEAGVTHLAGGTAYTASGMIFAGTTAPEGISGCLYDCGYGHPEEIPQAVAGSIALLQRGSVDGTAFYFSEKIENVQAKGAIGAVIYNNEAGSFSGTLGTAGDWIPVVCVSGEDGQALRQAVPDIFRLVNYFSDDRGLYGLMSGTSMAAPYVSGLVALMRAHRPDLGFADIRSAVLANVLPSPAVEGMLASGGRVGLYDALGEMLIAGDVTGDDRVRLDDLITTLQILTKIPPAAPVVFHPEKSDINCDGRIGMEEALYILDRVTR